MIYRFGLRIASLEQLIHGKIITIVNTPLILATVKKNRSKYESLDFKEQQKKLGEDVSSLT